jgi:tRNA (cmo5U34)-methyltransferase
MPEPMDRKSTTEEIRARFDRDVERFSRLETGQQATMDAPLVLELVAACCARHLRSGDAILVTWPI